MWFTNFGIHSITKIIYVAGDGSKYHYMVAKLVNTKGVVKDIKLPASGWVSTLIKRIERDTPGFIIYSDVTHNVTTILKRIFDEIFQKLIDDQRIISQFIYLQWGWGELQSDFTRTFYDGSLPNCLSKKNLMPQENDPVNHKKFLTDAVNTVLGVTPLNVSFPISNHVLLAYMDALFRDAIPGFGVRHSMLLTGDTGIGKSSLLTALCNVCSPEEERLFSLRSTEPGIRDMIRKEGHDDCICGDDYNLEGSITEVRRKTNIFQNINRDKSNGIVRITKLDRQNKNNKIVENVEMEERHDEMRGSIIFNGETKIVSEIVSGTLRYIVIQLSQQVNMQLLYILQTTSLWKYLVSMWIRFLQDNYSSIVNYIKLEVAKRRQSYQMIDGRLKDAFIQQMITQEIFAWFLLCNEVINEEGRTKLINDFYVIMSDVVNKQATFAKKQAPHLLFLLELWSLMGDKIVIAENVNEYTENPSKFTGYRQNGLVFLKRDEAFRIIVTAFADRREYFPATVEDISRDLKLHGFTSTDNEGFLKRASSLIEGRPRMLALIEDACLQFIDSNK